MSEISDPTTAAPPTIPSGGYRKKPVWIYLTSLVLILSPLGNLLWSLASMNVPDWYLPKVWFYWARFVTAPTWALLGLLFISGVSLLFVRRWSWTFSMVVIGLIGVYDLIMIKHFAALGMGAVIAMIAGTVSFGFILYFSEFRKPYLNPRTRWWETSPRFKVDLPAGLVNFPKMGIMTDISRSGVFIEWPQVADVPDLEGNCQVSLPQNLKLHGNIRRKNGRGLGIEFINLSRVDRKSLENILKTLNEDPTKVSR